MKIKYGILVLALIVCVVGGVYAATTPSNPISGVVMGVLGSNSNTDQPVQNDSAPTSDDNISTSDNGTTPVSNQESSAVTDDSTPVIADNVDNNIGTNNNDQPDGTQTIYLNEDNISTDGNNSLIGYVRPNKTDNNSLGYISSSSQT